MTNEEKQQAIEWLKRRPVMMAGAKRMYDLAVEALEAYVPDMNVGKTEPSRESDTEITRCSDDTISRRAAIEKVEGLDWYHINKQGELVHGAARDSEAFYKAEDIYRALNDLSAVEPSCSEIPNSWIPVTERLPEIGELVLVCCMYGDGYMDQTIDSRAKDGNWWSNIAFNDPDPAECCKVIAWMPLPEPYQAERGEANGQE